MWLTDYPDDSACHEDLFDPTSVDEESHPADTANRPAVYRWRMAGRRVPVRGSLSWLEPHAV